MPLISTHTKNPAVDGRQSRRALEIQLGVERLFSSMHYSVLSEFTLKSGRRADILALGPKSELAIIEIKSSKEDFLADNKWEDYLDWCDAFYFATLADVPADIFPDEQGFIIADQFGAEIIRAAQQTALAAARRKTIVLKAARDSFDRLSRITRHANGPQPIATSKPIEDQ